MPITNPLLAGTREVPIVGSVVTDPSQMAATRVVNGVSVNPLIASTITNLAQQQALNQQAQADALLAAQQQQLDAQRAAALALQARMTQTQETEAAAAAAPVQGSSFSPLRSAAAGTVETLGTGIGVLGGALETILRDPSGSERRKVFDQRRAAGDGMLVSLTDSILETSPWSRDVMLGLFDSADELTADAAQDWTSAAGIGNGIARLLPGLIGSYGASAALKKGAKELVEGAVEQSTVQRLTEAGARNLIIQSPAALQAAATSANQAVQAGATPAQALAAATVQFAVDSPLNLLPVSAGGGLIRRGTTGAALGGVSNVLSTAAGNTQLPEEAQGDLGGALLGGAGIQGMLALLLGRRARGARSDAELDPTLPPEAETGTPGAGGAREPALQQIPSTLDSDIEPTLPTGTAALTPQERASFTTRTTRALTKVNAALAKAEAKLPSEDGSTLTDADYRVDPATFLRDPERVIDEVADWGVSPAELITIRDDLAALTPVAERRAALDLAVDDAFAAQFRRLDAAQRNAFAEAVGWSTEEIDNALAKRAADAPPRPVPAALTQRVSDAFGQVREDSRAAYAAEQERLTVERAQRRAEATTESERQRLFEEQRAAEEAARTSEEEAKAAGDAFLRSPTPGARATAEVAQARAEQAAADFLRAPLADPLPTGLQRFIATDPLVNAQLQAAYASNSVGRVRDVLDRLSRGSTTQARAAKAALAELDLRAEDTPSPKG